MERVTINSLLTLVAADYRRRGNRSWRNVRYIVRRLRRIIGPRIAEGFTSLDVERLRSTLLRRRSATTVNRYLAVLRRAFRLGSRFQLVGHQPHIELAPEHNARRGFVEPTTFELLAEKLPADLADLARFCYLTGWRRNEAAGLTWDEVDLEAGRIQLSQLRSKNKRPRILVLVGTLRALIERRFRLRLLRLGPPIDESPLVFHSGGRPLRYFRRTWKRAAREAGCPELLFHDLRRSAVRNMRRAGVSESVTMSVVGLLTRAIFLRYDIADEQDMERALIQTQAYLASWITGCRHQR